MAPGFLSKIKSKLQTKADEGTPPPPLTTPRQTEPAVDVSQKKILPKQDESGTTKPILQERLWNLAYDQAKETHPSLVENYEKILSTELRGTDSNAPDYGLSENEISSSRVMRQRQMQALVRIGLNKTKRDAAVKQGTSDVMQSIQAVRGIIDNSVKASPEAAIAWVGACFVIEILSNPVSEALANRSGIAYVVSRMDWYCNLAEVLLDENRASEASQGLRDQLEKLMIQLYGKLLLFQMQSICVYNRNRLVTLARDFIKLDDWEGQLNGIKALEAAIQNDMSGYSTEEIRSRLQDISLTAQSQEARLQDIHASIQYQTEQQEKRAREGKDDQCLKDLYQTDPRQDKKRIEEFKGGLLKDSYRWILDHPDFQKWRKSSGASLFWIKGDPGKGKTMLTCGIVDELKKDQRIQVAYFLCQATDARLSSSTSVLRGLIYLLCLREPSLLSHVRAKYDVTGASLFEGPNLWTALTEILTNMANDPILTNAVLVIDALDECNDGLSELLQFIATIHTSSNMKWLVSSRNWPQIEEQLGNVAQELSLELNENHTASAIKLFIQQRVEDLSTQKKYDASTKRTVREYLEATAHGTFLWVALVCQELADPKVRKWHTIAKLKSFPPGLEALYSRMMDHLLSEPDESELYREILALASIAVRPLSFEEMVILTPSLEGLDDDVEEIIKSCGSFLTTKNESIFFVHQSAKDFILSKGQDQIFVEGLESQHYNLFKRSLEVLSNNLQRDIYDLQKPGISINEITRPLSDPLAPLRYSCTFCFRHLSFASPSQRNPASKAMKPNGLVHNFLREKYLNWLEALSLLEDVYLGLGMLLDIQKRADFVMGSDAVRFLLHNKYVIENYPLQVYVSALVFSPRKSLIKGCYHHEQPGWITLKPNVDDEWDGSLQTIYAEERAQGTRIALSPTDGCVASAGFISGTAKLWSKVTGSGMSVFKSQEEHILSISFSADGSQLAFGHQTIEVWDIATEDRIRVIDVGKAVSSLTFLKNGRLISCTHDGIQIWDVRTGMCVQKIQDPSGGEFDGFQPPMIEVGSQSVARPSEDGFIKIWNTESGTCIKKLGGYTGYIEAIDVLGDTLVAPIGEESVVRFWDLKTTDCIQTIECQGSHSNPRVVSFSPNGRWLAVGFGSSVIRIWDRDSQEWSQTFQGRQRAMLALIFSLDSSRLYSASHDGTIKIWDISTVSEKDSTEEVDRGVISLAMSPDKSRVAGGTLAGTLRILDSCTGLPIHKIQAHNSIVLFVQFSHDGSHLASGSPDGLLKLWNVETGNCTQTFRGHQDRISDMLFYPDDTKLVTAGSLDMTVRIWDIETGTCLCTFEHHPVGSSLLSLSNDGRKLVSGSGDGTFNIWDLDTGDCIQTLDSTDDSVTDLKSGAEVVAATFSPDDSVLALSYRDKTRLWDIQKDQNIRQVCNDLIDVWSLSFSADGSRLVAVSKGETFPDASCDIRVWDTKTWTCLQEIHMDVKLQRIKFHQEENSRLSTEIGVLELNTNGYQWRGYCLSEDTHWVMKDGEKILWIPREYQPLMVVHPYPRSPACIVEGSTVVMGGSYGRVVIMRFDETDR